MCKKINQMKSVWKSKTNKQIHVKHVSQIKISNDTLKEATLHELNDAPIYSVLLNKIFSPRYVSIYTEVGQRGHSGLLNNSGFVSPLE